MGVVLCLTWVKAGILAAIQKSHWYSNLFIGTHLLICFFIYHLECRKTNSRVHNSNISGVILEYIRLDQNARLSLEKLK